jgi:excisionase family DNA binding protein
MTTERKRSNLQEGREKSDEVGLLEPPKRNEFLTAKQLAEVLQISESTIHKLRRAGKIPAVMLTDRLIRFNLKEVKHALRSSQASINHHEPVASEAPDPQLSFEDFFKNPE